jgi:hypothetical protein
METEVKKRIGGVECETEKVKAKMDELVKRERRRQDISKKKDQQTIKEARRVAEGRNSEIEKGFEDI